MTNPYAQNVPRLSITPRIKLKLFAMNSRAWHGFAPIPTAPSASLRPPWPPSPCTRGTCSCLGPLHALVPTLRALLPRGSAAQGGWASAACWLRGTLSVQTPRGAAARSGYGHKNIRKGRKGNFRNQNFAYLRKIKC